MGLFEVAIPAFQDRVERRNHTRDGVSSIAGRPGTNLIP